MACSSRGAAISGSARTAVGTGRVIESAFRAPACMSGPAWHAGRRLRSCRSRSRGSTATAAARGTGMGATVAPDPRRTVAWKRARAIKLRGATNCEICQRWLDPSAPPRSAGSATVDHIVPLKYGGAPYDQANLRVSCLSCNARSGGAIRGPRGSKSGRSGPRQPAPPAGGRLVPVCDGRACPCHWGVGDPEKCRNTPEWIVPPQHAARDKELSRRGNE